MTSPKTLLIRGESIAAGKGCSLSYTHLLMKSKLLQDWSVIDKTREKDNSFDAVWTFEEDIAPHEPELIILHFGMNDAYYPVYRSEFKENLVQIIRLARFRFNSEFLLLTSHPFDNIHDMQMLNIYYRTIREVAVDLDCHWLPMHTWFRGYCEENSVSMDTLVQIDTRYPNESGHLLYYQAIEHKLLQIIDSMSKREIP